MHIPILVAEGEKKQLDQKSVKMVGEFDTGLWLNNLIINYQTPHWRVFPPGEEGDKSHHCDPPPAARRVTMLSFLPHTVTFL